jgi:hypothetical protein
MHRRTLIGCCAVIIMMSTPATACPWNGCGADAAKQAKYPTPYYYSAPVYSGAVIGPSYGYTAPKKTVRSRRTAK